MENIASDSEYEPKPSSNVKRQKRMVPAGETAVSNDVCQEQLNPNGLMDKQTGQRRAFPVDLPADVDLASVPATVEEYLAQVRKQAKMLSRNGRRNNENHEDSDDDDDDINDDDDDDFVFYRPANNLQLQLTSLPNESPTVCQFRTQRQSYKEYRDQLEELDAIDLPDTQKKWKQFIWDTSCEREYIAQINAEGFTHLLLIYFTKWLSQTPDDNLMAWIRALLASFEPSTAEDMALVRSLAKKAQRQYQQLHNVLLKELLLVLSVFFGQSDIQ